MEAESEPFGTTEYGNRDLIEGWGRRLVVVVLVAGAISGVLGFFTLKNSKDVSSLAKRNCNNLRGLAGIERTFIQQQQQQTKALLEHGVTFGIPRKDLPGLIEQSEATQQAFLNAFDALSLQNC